MSLTETQDTIQYAMDVHVYYTTMHVYLVVWSIDNNEREESITECLVEHLEETATVAGLHSFIVLIFFNLLLHSVQKILDNLNTVTCT